MRPHVRRLIRRVTMLAPRVVVLLLLAAPGCTGDVAGGQGGGGVIEPEPCAPMAAIPQRLWRLSNLQYASSIRDLLALPAAPEITGGGTALLAFYSKDTEVVDDRLEFSYYEAAEAAVAQIDPAALAACQTGEAEPTCAQRLATRLATQAYRRPAAATEVTDLLVLYTEGRKKDFATGIRLMAEGVLLSPSFAYRTEVGARGTLTPYEVASQLSYLFLDSLPDAPLMQAASDGRLATANGISAEVDRLLALPQARANVARIVVDWFGARETKGKDAGLYPEYTEELQQDLVTASRLFIEDVLWQGSGRMEDLLLSDRLFVNPRMAPVYGFSVPAGTQPAEFVGVDAPAGQRAGMLTQPGMMAAKSNTGETSVVHRGRWILNDVLCGSPVQDPPPGLLDSPAVQAALAMFKTERERTNYRLSTEPCHSCHMNIDPYGMLLENIDPIGRYRTTLSDGGPVVATWDLALSPSLTGPVTGPVQFAQGLVNDKLFSECATRKIASYALGGDQPKSCELAAVHDRFQASRDHSLSTMLRELVVASFMRTRGSL